MSPMEVLYDIGITFGFFVTSIFPATGKMVWLQERPMPTAYKTGLFFLFCLFAFFAFGPVLYLHAQDDGKSPTAAASPAAKEPQPIFFLRDGSRIAGLPGFDSLQVKTRYGTLTVPSTDLIRLRLAPRMGNENKEQIELEIQRLSGSDFDEREAAMDALRKLGEPVLPYLAKLIRADDEELRNRSSLLLGELKSKTKENNKHGSEFPALVDGFDEIVSSRFRIRGTIQAKDFSIKSRYGTLKIKTSDIMGVDFRFGGITDSTVHITGRQVVPANWSNTNLFVARGVNLKIRASGNLFVSNYNLNSGPQGTTRYSGNSYKNFPLLSLVGKIGKNGAPFMIGASYKAKSSRAGKLYLGVVPFRNNYVATGTFRVRVSAGE